LKVKQTHDGKHRTAILARIEDSVLVANSTLSSYIYSIVNWTKLRWIVISYKAVRPERIIAPRRGDCT
jgi:hypothetical protein